MGTSARNIMIATVLSALLSIVTASSTCGEIRAAFRSSTCCPTLGGTAEKVTNFSVTAQSAAAAPFISYTFATGMSTSVGVQAYTKIKSASCSYADLMGFVTSDPTILTEVPQFYSFLSS